MKRLLALGIALLATAPSFAVAQVFHIEDDKLATLPAAVESTIRDSENFEATSCKLLGRPINLTGGGSASGYVATTAEACDWGRALGPIWVVRAEPTPVLVLSYGGYALRTSPPMSNGLLGIIISTETSGHRAESRWAFDGNRYVREKR